MQLPRAGAAFRAGRVVDEGLKPIGPAMRIDLCRQINRFAMPASFAMDYEFLTRHCEVGQRTRQRPRIARHGARIPFGYAAAMSRRNSISLVMKATPPGGMAAIFSFRIRNRSGT